MTRYDEEFVVPHAAEPVHGAQMKKKNGFTLKVHNREFCEGENCCIHNPSDHPLKDAPMNWRSDRRMMERICKHGIGHPDPDDVAFHLRTNPGDKYYGVHGCDGCC